MMARTGMPRMRGLPEGGVRRRRRRVDRDAVAVGVDEAAGQGEHAQGDDERLQPAERDQPTVDGPDDAADHQGDDKSEQHGRTTEQAGRDDGGQAERRADADVDATGQHDDQFRQHDHADDRHLQQQIRQVGLTPEDRALGDGGDHQQGNQNVERVLGLEPGDEGLAAGKVFLVVVHRRRCRCFGHGFKLLGSRGRDQSWWVRAVRIRSSVSACSGSNSPAI